MTSGQQAKIDAVRRRQTRQEWYTEALTSVKDDINKFLNTYMSAAGEKSMLRSASYASYKSTTTSTANAAAVTAAGNAELGDITLQINRLAKNASVTSSARISANGTEISSSNTATLGSLSLATKLEFNAGGNISFAINGKTFSFSRDTTLQNMINTINSDETANVTMKYSRLSDAFTITSDTGGPASKVKITNLQGNAFGTNSAFGIGDVSVSSTGTSVSSKGITSGGVDLVDTAMLQDLPLAKALTFDSGNNISFSLNGKAFTFAKTTTLRDMLDTVNNDADAKVTMYYNASADGFTIMSDAGADSVVIKNLSGNAFGKGGAFGLSETSAVRGSDSEAVINGVTVTRPTNEYTIDGITYELKKVTQGTGEEQVTFSLERDYSASVSAVSKFIEGYNEIYTKLKDLVGEEDYSAEYPPLTDAQKSEMSSEEITAWEKRAKSGLLRQNKDLVNLLTNLRSSFFSALGGTGKNATELGLTASGYFDSNAGQIALNEDKISEALKNDPDSVIKMFMNGGSSATSTEQGLIYKLKTNLTTYLSSVTSSMKTVKKQLSSYGTEIGDLEDKLGKLADRYYAKFSRMETALSKLNSQSTYISQLFT
jgi:flagellar hook-associated protein 2